jgi:hypothetical protein
MIVCTGYNAQRDYYAMLNCFRGPAISQRFVKYADAMSVCPFSWNHFSCMEYDGRVKWSGRMIYEYQVKAKRPWYAK